MAIGLYLRELERRQIDGQINRINKQFSIMLGSVIKKWKHKTHKWATTAYPRFFSWNIILPITCNNNFIFNHQLFFFILLKTKISEIKNMFLITLTKGWNASVLHFIKSQIINKETNNKFTKVIYSNVNACAHWKCGRSIITSSSVASPGALYIGWFD